MNVDELQAGPELDQLVAEKVMGWAIKEHPNPDHPRMWMAEKGKGYLSGWTADDGSVACEASLPFGIFRPSVDIAAAWVVFEKMTELGFCSSIGNNGNKHAPHIDCRFWNEGDGRRGISIAETAPLAICRAALKATLGIDKT